MGENKDLGQTLTDTIMCIGYNPKEQKAFMISIPRDTFVGKSLYTAKPQDKINSFFNEKNPQKILDKVNELTGLNIEYYVIVNNKGLINLVDLLGGVEFDVPIDMNYDDKTQGLHIHLKKGVQTIDGKKAEMLLRFRHNNNGTSYPTEITILEEWKLGRNFILAVLQQTLNVKSVDELKEIISLGFKNIDTNLSLSYILSYLVFVTEFDTVNLTMEQLPGESIYTNGVWVFKVDEEKAKEMFTNVKF